MVDSITSSFNENSDKELVNISELCKDLILTKINNIRSNIQLLENQPANSNTGPITPIKESFCHAFYRLLGLPVIHENASSFYNPGYYGAEEGVNFQERENIDKSQSWMLTGTEALRESVCHEYNLLFERTDPTFKYKLDLLRERMKIDILDDNLDMFFESKEDPQTNVALKRKIYGVTKKILRPFKCSAKIVNNIYPITNSICAPFIDESHAIVNSVKLQRSYLEFVLRTRMSKDISTNTTKNTLYTDLQKKLTDLNLPSDIQKAITNFSDLENYIATEMFNTLFYVCKKTGEETKNVVKIVEQLDAKIEVKNGTNKEFVAFDVIDSAIEKKQAEIAAKNLILSVIPNYTIKDSTGNEIALQNYMECPLIAPFIKMVQPNIDDLKKQLDQLIAEKQKKLKQFNSLNKNIFYTIGEVNGLGLIDIICIMLAFWLIPKDHLLSMLDRPSFVRMYRNMNLRNEEVEKRDNNNGNAIVDIKKTMINFDKTVVQLLKSSEQIIKNNSV